MPNEPSAAQGRGPICGRFYAPPPPADYRYCYSPKDHKPRCVFTSRQPEASAAYSDDGEPVVSQEASASGRPSQVPAVTDTGNPEAAGHPSSAATTCPECGRERGFFGPCPTCGSDAPSAAITPFPSAESSMARPCGTCWRCGGTLYEYLTHGCTTTVRFSNPGGVRLTPWGTWEWRPW